MNCILDALYIEQIVMTKRRDDMTQAALNRRRCMWKMAAIFKSWRGEGRDENGKELKKRMHVLLYDSTSAKTLESYSVCVWKILSVHGTATLW